MRCSTLTIIFHSFAAVLLVAATVPAGWAQTAPAEPSAPSAQMPAQRAMSSTQPFDVEEYARPKSQFPNLLAPYTPTHVAPPKLSNTPRIDQLMHDGKLYVSMNDAVALALENNLDIAIARYNLNISDTDVWRAKAGSTMASIAAWFRIRLGPAWEDWARKSDRAKAERQWALAVQAPVLAAWWYQRSATARRLRASILS